MNPLGTNPEARSGSNRTRDQLSGELGRHECRMLGWIQRLNFNSLSSCMKPQSRSNVAESVIWTRPQQLFVHLACSVSFSQTSCPVTEIMPARGIAADSCAESGILAILVIKHSDRQPDASETEIMYHMNSSESQFMCQKIDHIICLDLNTVTTGRRRGRSSTPIRTERQGQL